MPKVSLEACPTLLIRELSTMQLGETQAGADAPTHCESQEMSSIEGGGRSCICTIKRRHAAPGCVGHPAQASL